MRSSTLALSSLLAACVNRPVQVSAPRFEAASARLRAGEAVTVEAERHPPVTLWPEQVVELPLVTGSVSIRIAELVRDCPLDDDPLRLCSAGEVAHVIVDHERVLSPPGMAVLAVGVVGGMIGLGYCWSECGGPWDTVSAITFITIGSNFLLGAAYASIRKWAGN